MFLTDAARSGDKHMNHAVPADNVSVERYVGCGSTSRAQGDRARDGVSLPDQG